MSAAFNLSSLVLGLIAWTVPLLCILRKIELPFAASTSFFCCALALLLQIMEIKHRVNISDLSAVADTISAVALSGAVMLCVSLLLNLTAWLRKN